MGITRKIKTVEHFEKIKKSLTNKKYLFRGESQEFDKISSGLYRFATSSVTQYITPINVNVTIPLIERISPQNLKGIQSELQNTHENFIKNVTEYIEATKISDTTSFSMEYIQHYGGITNYIDLTQSFEIATYFACSKDPDKDGRIIVVKSSENHNCINLHKDPRFADNRRIQKQEAVLIEPEEGFIKCDECEMILIISRNIKKDILEWLNTYNINERLIYPDEGDLEANQYIGQLKLKLYNLPKYLQQAQKFHRDGLNNQKTNRKLAIRQLKESIGQYNKAMKINPDNHTPYTLKANVFLNLFELTGEKSYAKESLDNCDVSIRLNPKGEEPLLHNPRFKTQLVKFNQTGIAYRIKGTIMYKIYDNHYLALKNLNRAIEINPNESQAYYHRGLIYCMQSERSTVKKNRIQILDMAIRDFSKQIDVNPKHKEYSMYTKCLELKNKAITAKNALTESEISQKSQITDDDTLE